MEKRSIFAILVCQLATVVIGKHVPVIGWANFRSLANTPTIPAGHFVTSTSLEKDYLDRIVDSGPHNVCIFIIDKLSIDDITKYSDAYNKDSTGSALTNLRAALESSKSSLVLPSADSSDLGAYLSSKVNGHVIELSTPSIKDQSLDSTKTNVIIVQLGSPDSNDREGEIRHADKMIAAVTSELESMSAPYTALLTAQQSPLQKKLQAKNDQESFNIGRQILETDDEASDDPFVFANFTSENCTVYFYSDSVTVANETGDQVALPVEMWDVSGSTCQIDTVNLVMSQSNITNSSSSIASFKFEINITIDSLDFWTASDTKVSVIFKDNKKESTQIIDMTFVVTPTLFSYHCVKSEAKAIVTADEKAEITSVIFNNLQLQAFNIEDEQFSYPNDCIGFFTEGIWMGLVTTLILLLILAFGFGMLANLSVMDKFDDPKGKTITIPQTAD